LSSARKEATSFFSAELTQGPSLRATLLEERYEIDLNLKGVSVTEVQFNADSTKVVFGCSGGSVGILNLKTKKKDQFVTNHTHGYPIVGVTFNCNKDELLASGSADGTISVQSIDEEIKAIAQFTTNDVKKVFINCIEDDKT
jgi:WD40 repeat protein